MYRKNPKYRKNLNPNQIQILVFLYKYRFVSIKLLTKHFITTNMYTNLRILEDKGFVGARYKPSYKLMGRPKAYYLSSKGVRILKSMDATKYLDIKYSYRAQIVSEQFIDQCLGVLEISNLFYGHYSHKIKFYTMVDMNVEDYGYFPKPLPSAYIYLNNNNGGQQFFLDFFQKYGLFYAIIRKLQMYVDYFDGGRWDDTGIAFPILLIVLDDIHMQKKLFRYISTNIEENMSIYVANKDELMRSSIVDKIWHNGHNPESLYTIEQIQASGVI